MGLTRVAISRPVFILMVIFGMVLMGAISFRGLNQELFPSINTPVISVVTIYPGAGPEDIERLVTKPIEDTISGLSNIKSIASTSAEGRSIVTITFNDTANPDIAAVDVERRVSAVRAALPTDAQAPTVSKFDFTASPIIYYALYGSASPEAIFREADKTLRPRLEAIDGVGSVTVSGGNQREIQIQVDPVRLAAYNLTYDQITAAVSRENQSRPGGSITQGDRELTLRTSGLFQSTEEMGRVVVSNVTAPIYLRDVATIADVNKKQTSLNRYDGQNAVAITVSKNATANEVRTANLVKADIKAYTPLIPAGMQVTEVYDRSVTTRSSLEGVENALVEAVIITALILLLFLHTFRSTAIVLFAIPTSLLTTFLWMSILGFTLNIMSTLALVLVIGVLVDDSIVVIENIVRHLELGESPWQAALNGRSEIGLAAIAITLVDVVVFLPVGFLSGTTGGFFKQFGLVIVAAVLTSLFVSFTLTPMLASKWLSHDSITPKGGPMKWFANVWDGMFNALERFYKVALRFFLRFRFLPPIFAVASVAAGIAIVAVGLVKFEFVPTSDSSMILVNAELPPGSSLDATDRVMKDVEQKLLTVPEVSGVLSFVGSGSGGTSSGPRFGYMLVTLVKPKQRTISDVQVGEKVKPLVVGSGGAEITVGAAGGFTSGQAVQVRVAGQDRAAVEAAALQVESILKGIKGAENIKNSSSIGSPEVRLVVDRNRLADQRLTADQVASALRTTVDGSVITKFRPTGADELDVRLISTPDTRATVDTVTNVPIIVQRTAADGSAQAVQVRLGSVTTLQNQQGPVSITRRNRTASATIGASLVGKTPLNDVTTPLQAQLTELQKTLPTGVTVGMGGEAEQQSEAFTQLFFALGLSIILIYMLLAALYESFIMPFATMFALPVALFGAFVGLAVSHNTLNLLTMIGMIVLMALVAKNGILLVDYTNTLRQRGRSRHEALLEAGPTRLRPILMTSAALGFGLLPIALAIHEGSEIYAGIGAMIIGGMLTSTVLSLIVVPTVYTYFDDLQNLIVAIFHWRPFRKTPKGPGATSSEDSQTREVPAVDAPPAGVSRLQPETQPE